MQTYNFKFDPATNNGSTVFQIDADLFVYESGRATPDSGNTAVLVKPDNGAEIVLKPGQRFRLAPGSNAKVWNVRPVDPAATIQSAFVIGSGEFDDANTLNKFSFDTGSGPLPMNIMNTPTNRVPVDVATPYDTCWTNNATTTQYQAIEIVAPALNVRGIIVSRPNIFRSQTGNGRQCFIAHTQLPTDESQGDLLHVALEDTAAKSCYTSDSVTLIPPGKGLYFLAVAAITTATRKTILYKIL